MNLKNPSESKLYKTILAPDNSEVFLCLLAIVPNICDLRTEESGCQIRRFGKQIFNPVQSHPTNQAISCGDYRYIKPKRTISGASCLDTMAGGFDRGYLPAPKQGMLVFDNFKGKPDADGG